MRRVPFTAGRFLAPWWLPEGHSQTVFGGKLRMVPRVSFSMERWTMPDGEVIRADRATPHTPVTDETPTLLVLHGLEGSSDAPYVRGMMRAGLKQGWHVEAVCFRGCGGLELSTPKSYHAGFTEDLEECVRRLGAERPRSPLMMVGYSLGGNAMLKMLGGVWGEKPPAHVVGACTVSSPFDLEQCAVALDAWHPMVIIYRERFLLSMRGKARAYKKQFPGRIDDIDIGGLTTFKKFDDIISARVTGDGNAETYWRNQSSRRFLDGIRVPTLLLNAHDDPLVPGHTVPVEQIAKQPALYLSLHRSGGHISFTWGTPTRPRNFAEEEAVRFFRAVLEHRATTGQGTQANPAVA
ncbi:MAG: alpha/beta fold hydrolase [Myxococcota bacterium]